MRRFFAFAMVSGVGWLLDMSVFAGVVWTDGRPFWGNVLGGLVGAGFSFTVSGISVFRAAPGHIWRRIAFYLIYTILAILVMSWLIDGTAAAILARYDMDRAWTAVFVKIALTPLILGSNFMVARHLLAPVLDPVRNRETW